MIIISSLKNTAESFNFGAESSSGSTTAEVCDHNWQKTYYSSGVLSVARDDIQKIGLSVNFDAVVALGNVHLCSD